MRIYSSHSGFSSRSSKVLSKFLEISESHLLIISYVCQEVTFLLETKPRQMMDPIKGKNYAIFMHFSKIIYLFGWWEISIFLSSDFHLAVNPFYCLFVLNAPWITKIPSLVCNPGFFHKLLEINPAVQFSMVTQTNQTDACRFV